MGLLAHQALETQLRICGRPSSSPFLNVTRAACSATVTVAEHTCRIKHIYHAISIYNELDDDLAHIHINTSPEIGQDMANSTSHDLRSHPGMLATVRGSTLQGNRPRHSLATHLKARF
jgi:hypothetical protein